MSISSLCNYDVATVEASADITEVAIAMREAHVGDVIVVEQRGSKRVPVGIVTDRDLVLEVLAEGVDPRELTVRDIMSTNLVTVREDSGLEFALREMGRAGVRRLPVVDDQGELVGVLTSDDVIVHLGGLAKHFADAIETGQFTETRRRP